jgi:hypothetical protein
MGNWNDGGLPYGARKVKLYPAGASDASGNTTWTGAAKGIYILESFSPTRGQSVLKRKDESGLPNGALGVDDFVEGSATVQLAQVATPLVDTGDAFTTVRRGASGAAESFVVINADEPEEQNGIRKQSIRIHKLVASPSSNLPSGYP